MGSYSSGQNFKHCECIFKRTTTIAAPEKLYPLLFFLLLGKMELKEKGFLATHE